MGKGTIEEEKATHLLLVFPSLLPRFPTPSACSVSVVNSCSTIIVIVITLFNTTFAKQLMTNGGITLSTESLPYAMRIGNVEAQLLS